MARGYMTGSGGGGGDFEEKSNKVTTISSSSTDIQYPSAKAANDKINTVELSVSSKENKEYLTINSTPYRLRVSNIDSGSEGYITLVI